MGSIVGDWHRQQEERRYKALFVNFVMEEYRNPSNCILDKQYRFSIAFGRAAYAFAYCSFGSLSSVSKQCDIIAGAIAPSLAAIEVDALLKWYVGAAEFPQKLMTDRLAEETNYYLRKRCPDVIEQKAVEKYAYIEIERYSRYKEEQTN